MGTPLPSSCVTSFMNVSLVSLAIPQQLEDILVRSSYLKLVYKLLTILGNIVLLGFLGFLTYKVQNNDFKHSSNIRIRRDIFIPAVLSSVSLCFISVASAFALSSPEIRRVIPSQFWNSKTKRFISTFVKIVLLIAVFVSFASTFLVEKKEKKISIELKEICGTDVNFFMTGYHSDPEDYRLTSKQIYRCKDAQGVINPLGCYAGYMLVPDYRPASPFIGFPDDAKLILVKPAQNNFKKIEKLIKEECGKQFCNFIKKF